MAKKQDTLMVRLYEKDWTTANIIDTGTKNTLENAELMKEKYSNFMVRTFPSSMRDQTERSFTRLG